MSGPPGAWEPVAALEGGTVSALVAAPAVDGTVAVFAATPVGVFRSDDGGANWRPLVGTDDGGAATVAVAGAESLVPSPTYAADGVLFVGGQDGLFRWQAARARWDHLLSGSRVLALAAVPGRAAPDRPGRPAVEPPAAASATLLVGTEDDGILVSRDGGRSWEGANPGLLDLTVLALAASPTFEEDGLAFAATPTGLYRTRNGAASWRAVELDDDAIVVQIAVQCLALSPTFVDDRLLLAGTEDHGLLRSDDGGRSWDVAADLDASSVNAVLFLTAARAVAATDAGVALSEDGGRSWRLIGPVAAGPAAAAPGPALAVAELPGAVDRAGGDSVATTAARVLLAGLPGGGVLRTVDAGVTWRPANAGLTAGLLVGLALGPQAGSEPALYAASLERGVLVSRDGGRSWTEANAGLDDPAVARIVATVAADGGAVLFAATAAGPYLSRDGATTWQPIFADQGGDDAPTGGDDAPTGGDAAGRRAADGESPALLAAGGGAVLVAWAGRLRLSTDGGRGWVAVAPPTEGGSVVALALSPVFGRDGALYLATAGPRRSDGSADLAVWRRRADGRWDRLLDERGAAAVHLLGVADGPAASRVLVGLGQRILRPRPRVVEIRGGVRRPAWEATVLPAALAGLAAPTGGDDRPILAATGAGLLLSTDGGATFDVWSDGLDAAGVVAVVASPDDGAGCVVYALGLGGTIWRRRAQ